jgi:hypothetical protein
VARVFTAAGSSTCACGVTELSPTCPLRTGNGASPARGAMRSRPPSGVDEEEAPSHSSPARILRSAINRSRSSTSRRHFPASLTTGSAPLATKRRTAQRLPRPRYVAASCGESSRCFGAAPPDPNSPRPRLAMLDPKRNLRASERTRTHQGPNGDRVSIDVFASRIPPRRRLRFVAVPGSSGFIPPARARSPRAQRTGPHALRRPVEGAQAARARRARAARPPWRSGTAR